MKLTYVADDRMVICDIPDTPLEVTLHVEGALSDDEILILGHLLARAPQMLLALDYLTSVEADDDGDRTASPDVMVPIWEAITAAGGQAAILFVQANR